MPEAVIVDAARTPIGRAFKGSLAQLRPDETAAHSSSTSCSSATRTSTRRRSRTSSAAAACRRACRPSTSAGSSRCSPSSSRRRSTASRSPATAPPPRRDPPRGNAIKAGEGDAYIAAGVEFVSRYNERTEPAGVDDRNPNLIGENGQPNAYIDMGLTAVNVAKRYEVSRADMDKYAQRSQELAVASQEDGLLRPRDRPGDTRPGRQRGRQGRRPAGRLDAREALRAPRGVRRRRRHRRQLLPAQRRRRGGAPDVRHQGQGARADPEGADRHRRHLRATSPSTWASPRSARSRRCSSAPG